MEQTYRSRYDSVIKSWDLLEAKPTIKYLPKWKIFIGKLFNIPIKPKYKYIVRVHIKDHTFLEKGYCVRFTINGEYRYFTVEGTEHFGGFYKWILKSAEYEDVIPNETYGQDTLIQLIHKGVVPEYEPI